MYTYALNALNTVSQPQFQDWTDANGLMADNPNGGSTGNGMLFMAHYVFGLSVNGALTQAEKDRVTAVYRKNQREPGLYDRLPTADDWYQAHDDLLGLMGADALMNPNRDDRALTKELYHYGVSTDIYAADTSDSNQTKDKWNSILFPFFKLTSYLNPFHWGKICYVWNNVRPGKFHTNSWLGRRMEVIATMQMASGSFVNPIYWLYWAVSMLTLVYGKKNTSYQDGYTLRFHSALACEGHGWATNWICQKVRKQVQKDYGGFGEMLLSYFNQPTHPIVPYTAGKY